MPERASEPLFNPNAHFGGVTRSTAHVTASLSWTDGVDWHDLAGEVRNEVRDHLDAACDLIERTRHA